MNLWLVFLTGLTSGGVTCAAMQGGLLAGVIANQKNSDIERNDPSIKPASFDLGDWGPVSMFLSTKFLAHVALGALLGALGSVVSLSPSARLFFQGFAALFMFASAMNLLDVHPIFRYLAFTPPRFTRRLIKNTSAANRLFAPGVLGLMTILIPCGVTQAMEVVAISSGNAIQGALTMGVFILGTAPVFAAIGLATAKLSEYWRLYFLRAAALLLIAMAVFSLNGILQVIDSPYSLERLGPRLVQLLPPYNQVDTSSQTVPVVDGVQKVKLDVGNHGYTPNYFQVKVGIPVELTLATTGNVYSCATSFTFKAFNISDLLKPSDSKVHIFTPTKKGLYTFACSMGMYSGIMEVI